MFKDHRSLPLRYDVSTQKYERVLRVSRRGSDRPSTPETNNVFYVNNDCAIRRTLLFTQWFVQNPRTTAGPKDLAGFILAPVYLICGEEQKKKKTQYLNKHRTKGARMVHDSFQVAEVMT